MAQSPCDMDRGGMRLPLAGLRHRPRQASASAASMSPLPRPAHRARGVASASHCLPWAPVSLSVKRTD